MSPLVRGFRDFFVSLKLTIVLLALAILLIFAATLDQVNLGIWAVQQKYFHSLFVLWRVGDVPIPVFPGGYLIGGLLMINLIWAQITRFKFTAKKSGIWLTHIGLIVLLLGELFSGLWQEEYMMQVDEGQSKNYSESYRLNELAIVDVTDPTTDEVVAIPEARVAEGESIQHPKLPFRVVPKIYYPNADLLERAKNPSSSASPPLATAGPGLRYDATPLPVSHNDKLRNLPAAYLELISPEGSLGTWLISLQLQSQRFDYGGRTWKLEFRSKRSYKPFSFTLIKFSFDRYAGTEIPKNFSSRLKLNTPDGKDDREVLIYMNNPLRYGGLTFYQADYDHVKERYTILQVVRNPSWTLPYIACILMTLGLVIQFGIHLVAFMGKRRALAAKPAVT